MAFPGDFFERFVRMEEAVKKLVTDAVDHEDRTAKIGARVDSLERDKSWVQGGAWVANGLTVVFVGIIMAISNRLMATEAENFKASVIKDVVRAVHEASSASPRK